jgi:Leucine-rich repeat (LRR) protein
MKVLDASNTTVAGLSPLMNLTGLERLYLGNTSVSDISPLAELWSLTTLHLNDTPVTDLAPLAKMRSLRKLDLGSIQVRYEEVARLRQALPGGQITW